MPYKSTKKNREYQRTWAQQRLAALGRLKRELKKGGCILCNEKAPCCLTFHHLDPATKLFDLGSLKDRRNRRYKTEEAVRAEAKKCVVLCANCHAKVHAGIVVLGEDLVSSRVKA